MSEPSHVTPLRLRDWWLPDGIAAHDVFSEILEVPIGPGRLMLSHAVPSVKGICFLADELRSRCAHILKRRGIDSIISSLDRLARSWLEPDLAERWLAVSAIASISGFSTRMVEHAIDLEMRSSLGEHLVRALRRELGNPRALDGFMPVPELEGRTRAIGPRLVGGIFSANIPALPHLTVMRALLVKAACLGRGSSDEPVFLPLYARTLASIDPVLASCLAVVHWDREDRDVEGAFLAGIDHLIAYGGEEALSELRKRVPRGLNASWHGHRLGFAVVLRSALTRENLPKLARALAYDFTVFDQQACLSPQVVYVEAGGEASPDALADALAEAMLELVSELPPRRLSPAHLGQLRGSVAELELRQLCGEPVRLASGPATLQGAVVVEADLELSPGRLERSARFVPIGDWRELAGSLEVLRPLLQNVAVAGDGPEAEGLKEMLAGLGVSRICQPGQMATPSMMWFHDGRPRLGELVRWCDEESWTDPAPHP